MDTNQIIQTIAVYALPVLLAITLHEAAHGFAARAFGDNTAWMARRITLNPLRHIDPLGTVVMPIAIYLATQGAFLFGYAKPVPVDFNALRHPKRDMIWVALAGPGANLFQAIVWAAAFIVLRGLGIDEPFLVKTCQAGVFVNVIMMVFNLLPLPPMDGGRVLVGLLPWRAAIAVSRIEPYGFFILLALLLLGLVSEFWMRPLMSVSFAFLDLLLAPLQLLFPQEQ
ncbi:MAG: site-2 protease family protein [Betaproteobacteria bacterium]|nr:site-2 protease family protein [Betaproteobacteria bacterium]